MKLTPDLSLIAVLVIFLLTYLVVRRFLIVPVNRILVERDTEIRSAEQLYEQSLSTFNEATAAMEAQLHTAKREAASIREQFRTDAAAHRLTVVEKTRTEADVFVKEAEAKLSSDVKVAREKIVTESESLARLAAQQILGRAV
jgi:F-type H+-transporting ATPase subunit b